MTRSRALRAVKVATALVLVVTWMAFLRPTWLGGPATFVLVRGDSMLPTYQNGDLLLALAQPGYSVGDAVAYRVPASEVGAGHLVIHRIVEIQADGSFVFQGDNNPAVDPWRISSTDLAGHVAVRLPGVGKAMMLLLSPTILGGLAAAAVVMAFVARSGASRGGEATTRVRRPVQAWGLRMRLAADVRGAHAKPGDS